MQLEKQDERQSDHKIEDHAGSQFYDEVEHRVEGQTGRPAECKRSCIRLYQRSQCQQQGRGRESLIGYGTGYGVWVHLG